MFDGGLDILACWGGAPGGKDGDPAKLKEQYAARSVELLRKAESAGFFKDKKNIEHMKKDTDLEPLRQREDYKKLLKELETK